MAAAVALTVWFWQTGAASPTPPGQYPLEAPRPEWPVSVVSRSFRPAEDMGSDDVSASSSTEPKFRCAVSDTCSSDLMIGEGWMAGGE